MNISFRFVGNKPKWSIGFYYLAFAICLLIAAPFALMAIVSELSVCFSRLIIRFMSEKLDIDFEL